MQNFWKYLLKHIIKKMTRNWEKMFAKQLCNKGFVSRLCKEEMKHYCDPITRN